MLSNGTTTGASVVVVVVVLSNCFLSLEVETEAEADCWTDDDEKEAETDELLDMVLSAGREATRLASTQTATAIRDNLLLFDDAIFYYDRCDQQKNKQSITE